MERIEKLKLDEEMMPTKTDICMKINKIIDCLYQLNAYQHEHPIVSEQTPKEPECEHEWVKRLEHDYWCRKCHQYSNEKSTKPECKPNVNQDCKPAKKECEAECVPDCDGAGIKGWCRKKDELAERLRNASRDHQQSISVGGIQYMSKSESKSVADEARRWVLEQFQGVEHHTIAEELWRLKGE